MKSRDAVVLSADVFGYTRLINDFESETVERLVIYHKIFRRYISRAGGRIFNYAGDAVLAEFAKIDDALIAAVKIQQQIAKHNRICPLGQRMMFRMGINAGKVFERGADLLGDTVNIAARLQAVAQPGGICISEGIYLGMSQGLDVITDDLGLQALKNIPTNIQAYNVAFDQGSLRRNLTIPTGFNYFRHRPKTVVACFFALLLMRTIVYNLPGDIKASSDTKAETEAKFTPKQIEVLADYQKNEPLKPISVSSSSPAMPKQEATGRRDSEKSEADAVDPVKAGLFLGSLLYVGLAAAVAVSDLQHKTNGDQSTQPDGKRKPLNQKFALNQVGTINVDTLPSPDLKVESISRCTLVIDEKTIVDATGCQYVYSAKYMTFAASSTNGKEKYLARVNLNSDSTGNGFLSSATSAQERSLGTMTRKGACWISVDESVRMCAWK